jgi:hypothetical protein
MSSLCVPAHAAAVVGLLCQRIYLHFMYRHTQLFWWACYVNVYIFTLCTGTRSCCGGLAMSTCISSLCVPAHAAVVVGLLCQRVLGGVNHCRSRGRLAKFCSLIYRGKYSAVVGRKLQFFWYVRSMKFQAMGSLSQSQRCISPCTSNHGTSPDYSQVRIFTDFREMFFPG